ncbi:family 10 glycosylhydrolase [Streptomyces sp. SID13666]|uniref:glycoside hydrolase family 10 protein n=1 Tax=unclassified Streptomyces TaxID=2593676 RepID=UPI0013C289AA|nr:MULTISPECIES: family 10 glycosylhydrolase [unclassified Streptomyces]NEA58968.1 family 10 glycosylhydrolase [Streptomyces sp. SID13666]NEA75296.1 family 10 glycosylhydrolase [Streptomyces sp. SID13588]
MGHITRRTFAVGAIGTVGAVALAAATGTPAAAAAKAGTTERERPARQFRGMWIATVANTDWPSAAGLPAAEQRRELLDLLDTAVERRLNAVILQVRPTADALWASPYEPWSQYLSGTQGQDPGWDPLGTAVREAHRRGLELHAWFNPYRIANNTDPNLLTPTHPARLHPEWVVPYGGKLYYNPGLPEVRRFVQDAMLDAVRRYPVDAVHWDDYFYPYPVAGQVFDDDAAYAAFGSGFPDRAAWRRDNTDRLVRETAVRIKRIRPHSRFGISPFGVWRNRATDPLGSDTTAGVQTYDNLHADTRGWVKKGWIDYIVPQVYWNIGFPAADYAKLVPWWADVVSGTDVDLYVGEALYKVGVAGQPAAWQDPAELSRHLTFDRDFPQVRGNVFFSSTQVASDPRGAMTRVVADHYGGCAHPPH